MKAPLRAMTFPTQVSQGSPEAPVSTHATEYLVRGLAEHLAFRSDPQPELEALRTSFEHVLFRTAPAGAAIALEVVIVIDRTAVPEGMTWPLASLHQLGARAERLAPKSTLGTVTTHRRFTLVEIGSGPPSDADRTRLLAYKAGFSSVTLIEAMYFDASARKLWPDGAGLSQEAASALLQAESPSNWVRSLLVPAHVSGSPPGHPESGWPRLFSPAAIALAAFFASPLAGGLLFAWNLHRLKKTRAAVATAIASLLLMIGFLVVAVTTDLPPTAFYGGTIGATVGLAFAARRAAPHTSIKASPWGAVLVSVLSVAFVLAVSFGVAFSVPAKKVEFPSNVVVYYEDGATRQDAERVGKYLTDRRFLGKDTGLRISRSRREITLSFVTEPYVWTSEKELAIFQRLADSVARDVYPEMPVRVVLTNAFGLEKKTVVGQVR